MSFSVLGAKGGFDGEIEWVFRYQCVWVFQGRISQGDHSRCVNVSDVRSELFSAFHARHGAAYDGAETTDDP